MKNYFMNHIDPQTPVSVRFGLVHDDGHTEWDDRTEVRLFFSDGMEKGEWFLTPMSLDGRPFGMTLEGHSGVEGIIPAQNSHYVMQVLSLREPILLKNAYKSDDFEQYLEDNDIQVDQMSPLGKVFATTMIEFQEEVPDKLIELMLESL